MKGSVNNQVLRKDFWAKSQGELHDLYEPWSFSSVKMEVNPPGHPCDESIKRAHL